MIVFNTTELLGALHGQSWAEQFKGRLEKVRG